MQKRLLALLISQLVAVSLFCAGFFPQKKVLKGEAQFIEEPALQKEAKPVFNKLVLVVIDALRSDFLFEKSNSKFSFLHSLLNEGSAWGFTAYSNPPTVTLPRLKGITTGSTPNFLDAILNVAEDDSSSNLNDQDSWVSQFFSHGKKLRFFGDDTWLKLFPKEYFDEYDGTNSFFVSDFEQVDHNVTRHLPKQLNNQQEWDALILHYLGLDHIGHKGGPNSQFMPAKQVEMDEILKQIYENVDNETLICVMGDHGMNDVGNHGGSSAGETSAALALISKKLRGYTPPAEQIGVQLPVQNADGEVDYQYLTRIQQVDIVPTLAALFNFPIPKNSVGILIQETLQLLDPKLAKIKLLENLKQLDSISNGHEVIQDEANIDQLYDLMKDIQSDLTRSATNYNYDLMGMGLALLVITTIITVLVGSNRMELGHPFFFTMIVSLLIGLSSFGSSFVEEEHQIWWWISTGATLASSVYLVDEKYTHFVILVCLRIIRAWNNSGQKHFNENTVFDILKRNPTEQWYLNFFAIVICGLKGSSGDIVTFMCSFVLTALCLVYKVTWALVNRETVPHWLYEVAYKSCSIMMGDTTDVFDKSLIPLAQLFFRCFAGCVAVAVVACKMGGNKNSHAISTFITLLLIFQSQSPNIPLFFVFDVLKSSLNKIVSKRYNSDAYMISAVSLILQYFTFFHFGGTNSIATVDLSNAYNGVSENYNIYAVGFMMCVSNFAPSIYWSTFTWSLLYKTNKKWHNFFQSKLTFLMFNCISGCCLMFACVALRFHLFIWSVFSPKLCYYATWNIFMNLVIGWILEIPLALTT